MGQNHAKVQRDNAVKEHGKYGEGTTGSQRERTGRHVSKMEEGRV